MCSCCAFLGQRFLLVKQLKVKSQAQIKIEDKDREAELLAQYRSLAATQGLDQTGGKNFSPHFEAFKKNKPLIPFIPNH